MKTFAVVILLFFAELCLAYPSRIIIFRHGEKPAQGDHLNEKGRKRAKKLVTYLTTNPVIIAKGIPSAIFAAGIKAGGSSHRSIETVSPLARYLNIPVNSDFLKDEIVNLEKYIADKKSIDDKVVVISWQHSWIPPMAKQFGLEFGPEKWNDDDFDTIWILDFKSARRLTGFQIIYTRLLE